MIFLIFQRPKIKKTTKRISKTLGTIPAEIRYNSSKILKIEPIPKITIATKRYLWQISKPFLVLQITPKISQIANKTKIKIMKFEIMVRSSIEL